MTSAKILEGARRRSARRYEALKNDVEFRRKLWMTNSRQRARKLGLEYNLTIDDYAIPEFCPVLGIKLEFGSGDDKNIDTSPSIDRVDNSKGYVKGNVRVISNRANSLKKDATIDELKALLKYMSETL